MTENMAHLRRTKVTQVSIVTALLGIPEFIFIIIILRVSSLTSQ